MQTLYYIFISIVAKAILIRGRMLYSKLIIFYINLIKFHFTHIISASINTHFNYIAKIWKNLLSNV